MADGCPDFLRLPADICVPSLMSIGMLLLCVSGFGIETSWLFWTVAVAVCALCCVICRLEMCRRHRLMSLAVMTTVYLFLLFVFQGRVMSGAAGFLLAVTDTLGRVYSGGFAMGTADSADTALFVLFVSAPIAVWLAVAFNWVNQMLMVYICVFPVVILLALCGAAGNVPALFMLLTGLVMCRSALGVRRQYRMWGGENESLRLANARRYDAVRAKSIAGAFAVCILLSVPGYLIARPALSISLKPLHEVSLRVQSSFINRVMQVLPELTAGKLQLELEAVGSGVADGHIESDEGYILSDVEDLSVTVDTRPTETIFLKGYVGAEYGDGVWNAPYASTFDGAAMNWNTDGSPRLYIQNLPFLRTAYVMNEKAEYDLSSVEAEPVRMQVERINANSEYTYVPYGAYLNDYYTVEGGDGAVAAQTEQEDEFYFYFREDMTNVLVAWNGIDGTSSVMDRTEDAYSAYCTGYGETEAVDGVFDGEVSDMPEADEMSEDELIARYESEVSDMKSLAVLTSVVTSVNGWSADKNTDEISSWIRDYLADNYVYDKEPDTDYGDSDALEYFLFDGRRGNSVQFASAAVAMYRMFGVPARYVVGYEIPKDTFAAQTGGGFNAVVTGEYSQAWAEVYVDGIGWLPKDMTPGVIGTYEETGGEGELIEPAAEGSEDVSDGATDDRSLSDDEAGAGTHTSGNMSVGQFIRYVAGALAVFMVIFAAIYGGGRLCECLGYSPLGRRSCEQRLVGVFRALYERTRRVGLPDGVTSQDEEFVAFCEDRLRDKDSGAADQVRSAIGRLYEVCYGGEKAEEADIEQMRSLLMAVMKLRKAA